MIATNMWGGWGTPFDDAPWEWLRDMVRALGRAWETLGRGWARALAWILSWIGTHASAAQGYSHTANR